MLRIYRCIRNPRYHSAYPYPPAQLRHFVEWCRLINFQWLEAAEGCRPSPHHFLTHVAPNSDIVKDQAHVAGDSLGTLMCYLVLGHHGLFPLCAPRSVQRVLVHFEMETDGALQCSIRSIVSILHV